LKNQRQETEKRCTLKLSELREKLRDCEMRTFKRVEAEYAPVLEEKD